MASVVISGRGGQLGGATDQTYYCFDCDRSLSIIATSDSGLICPICGDVVLEEFETPSSSSHPSPPLPPQPNRSTTFIDPQSFFPTSDTDSDVELSDPFPPPPPPPRPFFFTSTPSISTTVEATLPETVDSLSYLHIRPPPPPPPPTQSIWDIYFPLDGEVRHLRPPSPPPSAQTPPPPPPLPSVSLIGRPPLCPQLPSAPAIDNFSLLPHEENDTTQYSHFDGEADAFWPPLSPPPPPEHLLRSPPLSPSSSSSDVLESFYTPRELEEDTPTQQMRSPIPPPPPPTSSSIGWDYFFPSPIPEPESNSPNHQMPSQLQPPPPPPWLQQPPPREEGWSDMKMTKKLLSEWECHQCSICIDNFELNQKVKLTPCNHLYHSDCLSRWLDSHKSCPVCRFKLPSQ